MRIPGIFLLPALLAALALTNCSDSSSSGGIDYIKGDGNATADVKVPTDNMTVPQILDKAVENLKAEKWDEAIAYYNAAYAKDNNDPAAIIYSTLANLAKISTDKNMVALIKNNFGFTEYPDRLNALFSNDWMKKVPEKHPIYGYYDNNGDYAYWYDKEEIEYYKNSSWTNYSGLSREGYYRCEYSYSSGSSSYACTLVSSTPRYDSTYMPVIRTPDWVKGAGSIYNETLLSGNVMSTESWVIALLANIVDRNSNGLNQTLDDVIDAVFGASYNEATSRLQKLESRKNETINLNPYFIEQLNLEDIFDEFDEIGWAEVNAVISAMLAVKASLEWLSSYDLNTDLNWLKYAWKDDDKDITNRIKGINKNNLPFNNNFLKVRSNGASRMSNAKETYKKAIQGLQASYQVIASPNSIYPTEIKDSYNSINGGFAALLNAIDAGKEFYIPKEPNKGTWPTSKTSNVIATIDFGKFFEVGRFSLDKIFETKAGKPVLYGCYWHWDYHTDELKGEVLTTDNYLNILSKEDEWGDGYELCLKLNMNYIKEIADADELTEELNDGLTNTGITGDLAKVIFEKYYK